MIRLYEKNGITVNTELVAQYLQNAKTARNFAMYYDLFRKYRSDYQIEDIVNGKAPVSIQVRAKEAKFDERLSLLGLILDRVNDETRGVIYEETKVLMLKNELSTLKKALPGSNVNAVKALNSAISAKQTELQSGLKASSLSPEAQYALRGTVRELEKMIAALQESGKTNGAEAFEVLKQAYGVILNGFKAKTATAGAVLSNVFKFLEAVYSEGQEMVIFVTELTVSPHTSKYISRYGCPEYFKHNKELLFYERQMDIIRELEIIDIDE